MPATLSQKTAFARDLNRGIALSLGNFEESLMRKMAEMGESVERAMLLFKAFGLEAFNRMKARTPVDTGFARSGWRITSVNWSKDLVVIDIWNEVSYIIFLEYGWSKKAPLGMMRITLEDMGHRISTGRGLSKKAALNRTSLSQLKTNQGGWKT